MISETEYRFYDSKRAVSTFCKVFAFFYPSGLRSVFRAVSLYGNIGRYSGF